MTAKRYLSFRWLCLAVVLALMNVTGVRASGFKSFMAVDGLSDNRVLCAMQDSYGFVWIGTANGLNCFDGHRNGVYRNMVAAGSTFENDQITSLLEQGDDVWFGGSFGIYIYNRSENTFTRFDKPTRYGVLVSSTVDRMMRTQNGLVWICTQGQGLFLYDPKAGTLSQDSRHNGFVSDMTIGTDGLVYVVTLDGKLMVYSQEGQFQREYAVPGYVVDKNKMCIANVGSRLFIGCDQGLFRLNAENHVIEKTGVLQGGLFVKALLAQEDHLLVGTGHGLFDYDVAENRVQRIDDPAEPNNGLSDDCINGLLTTTDGTLWVLTEYGGINYRPAQSSNRLTIPLPTEQGNPHNMVRALCPTSDGRLWIGTDGGLFVKEQGSNELHHPTQLRESITGVSSLMQDGNDLWIGTSNAGVFVMNMTTGALRQYTYSADRPYTIASNEVQSLLRTSRGDIYVGTSWGLRIYDRKRDHFMFFSKISSMTSINDIAEDHEGNVWAASEGHGLFVKHQNETDFYTIYLSQAENPRSLPSNVVTSVACDSKGTVWVGTKGGGLCRYVSENDDFERIGSVDMPLQKEQIYFIQEDNRHELWLGTDEGLARIRADLSVQLDAMTMPSEGVREQKPWNASCCMPDGSIFIGCIGKILCFDPANVKSGVLQAPIYITHLSFPNIEDSEAELSRLGLDHSLYTTSAIRLPFADNHFTLHFASPRFSGRTLVHYEYMMEGFDKTWARGSDNREATYSNMSPGTYDFLLREAGNDNPEQYARLRVTILPPWYRTSWAYALYFLAAVLLIYFTFSRTSRRLRKRYEARMEEYRLLQEKENFQSKINFFINLVHEIRTPLSLINLPLEQMEEGELSDDNRNHVHAIRRNTNYLLGITNQLLDFQKAESGGGINLQLASCDVAQLLDGIYRQFKDPMKVQGESLQLQLPTTSIVTTLDRDKVSKVLMNLLGNSLKYAKSEVILRLEQNDEDSFSISVIDDGPGVPPADRDRIFDVYYQIAGDATAANLGTGLGLSYAKMLAKAHGGDITYTDAVGGGSNFTLVLPIRQDETAVSELKEDAPLKTADAENADSIEEKRSFRILLVEDNDELLKATGDGLRKWFFVLKAHDGIEALDVLRHHEVDVIVSDVMMPRMDGNELCKQLKSDINYSHLPVILLTAKTTVEAKLEGMQSGADIYMEKPFSMKQLHLQIISLLRMRQSFYEKMRQVEGTQAVAGMESEFGMSEQDIQFMKRLQELVRQNMRFEEFSIDILAEQMNMSRSSFYRKIKALTDMTPVDFMKTQRLERAAQLLRQGQRITEVADQVGFTSSSYFAKCFRAKYGVLPKDYLNSLKENAAQPE